MSIALGCTAGTDSGSSGVSTLATNLLTARSTDAGATWTMPSALNPTATGILGSDATPQAKSGAAGTWVAAWRSTKLGDLPRTDADLLLARSSDAGATWTGHAELNNNAGSDEGGDAQVQLATDGAGVWIAIWQSWDSLGDTIGTDGDVLFARSADDGFTWTDPAPLDSTAATDTEDDNYPQLATDGAGNWVVVWYTVEDYNRPEIPGEPPDKQPNPDRDILMSRSTDNGITWSPAVPLNTNAVDDLAGDTNPQIATDGTTWIAVWEIKDKPFSGTYPQGLGSDSDLMVARSSDAGLTWTAPVPLNTNAAQRVIIDRGRRLYTPQDDRFPQLATDGGTLWIAVWTSEDDLGSFATPVASQIGNDSDIVYARSTDDGATWSDPLWLNTNAPTDGLTDWDTSPTIATDGTTWIATWVSIASLGDTIGLDQDILTARSTDGGVTWTDPVPLNGNAAGDSGDDDAPDLSTDGLGNWVATWQATQWP